MILTADLVDGRLQCNDDGEHTDGSERLGCYACEGGFDFTLGKTAIH